MKLSLKFWRKRNNSRHELSVAQLELLRREDAEARRGAISPFSLNVGTDPSTKALGVGYTTSGPTPIIGTPLSEANKNNQSPTTIGVAPVTLTNSANAVGQTAWGCPAAAHATS